MNSLRNYSSRIVSSFYPDMGFFTAVTTEDTVRTPVYTIAHAALKRVAPDAELRLPEGCDEAMLEDLKASTSVYDERRVIYPEVAATLADLGKQILSLNETRHIQPPLDSDPFNGPESQAISYLIDVVEQRSAS